MITEGNLKKVLSVLGFQYNSEEKVYAKDYSKVSCQMKVDIAHQRLLFPAAIKGR